eukprot:TRINITY_DN5492_c0_g2_i4.p1 TRINITY_DN5492_c0_g2~~TRINITY_DN5492_c0_g2_i4.p1  ORF type:complete len:243 (+),score=45.92 TRINITY_DN5492_c0_g2_i4:87-815(+)
MASLRSKSATSRALRAEPNASNYSSSSSSSSASMASRNPPSPPSPPRPMTRDSIKTSLAGSRKLAPTSGFQTNSKGGIYVDRGELKQAFDFFDVKGKGHITMTDLKSRLSVFYKNLQPREYKFLMNNQNELSFDQLYNLLADNEITNFDPVAEAFKIYDPADSGFVSVDILTEIFGNLGFGKLSDDDVKILIQTADVDGDGRISLDDFRQMLHSHREGDEKSEVASNPPPVAKSSTLLGFRS